MSALSGLVGRYDSNDSDKYVIDYEKLKLLSENKDPNELDHYLTKTISRASHVLYRIFKLLNKYPNDFIIRDEYALNLNVLPRRFCKELSVDCVGFPDNYNLKFIDDLNQEFEDMKDSGICDSYVVSGYDDTDREIAIADVDEITVRLVCSNVIPDDWGIVHYTPDAKQTYSFYSPVRVIADTFNIINGGLISHIVSGELFDFYTLTDYTDIDMYLFSQRAYKEMRGNVMKNYEALALDYKSFAPSDVQGYMMDKYPFEKIVERIEQFRGVLPVGKKGLIWDHNTKSFIMVTE